MLLKVSDLFEDEVSGNDGKRLGTLVNIIIDTRTREARMLIFPEERTKSFIKRLVESAENVTITTLKEIPLVKDQRLNEVLKKMAGETAEQASKIAREYLSELEEKLKKKYYLISSWEIAKTKGKSVTLKRKPEDYEGECRNISVSEDDDLAFYDNGAIPDVTSLLPITLNSVSIRNQLVADPENKKGRIMNVQIDSGEGMIGKLIVQTIGKGASRRLVDAEDIDWSTMISKKEFESFPIQE